MDLFGTGVSAWGRNPETGHAVLKSRTGQYLPRIVEEAESRSADRDGQIEAARDAFYRGFVAEAIVRYVSSTRAMDTSGRRHGGLLDGDDFAA